MEKIKRLLLEYTRQGCIEKLANALTQRDREHEAKIARLREAIETKANEECGLEALPSNGNCTHFRIVTAFDAALAKVEGE